MAFHSRFKFGLLAAFVSLSLTGCGLDGDDGEQGATGAQGPQGDQGQPGTDGTNGSDGSNGADASIGIDLSVVGRAVVNAANPAGAAEIVQFHAATNTIYASNAAGNNIAVINAGNLTSTAIPSPTDSTNLNATSLALPADVDGTAFGGINSIAISDDLLAVAVAGATQSDNGFVLFYNGLNDSAPVFLDGVEVGNLPDMVTFTPNGGKVIVANEGEPSGSYANDPMGTISVIDILASDEPEETAETINFMAFNDQQETLEGQGMHFPNPTGRTLNGDADPTMISVAQDIEPEYVAATNTHAYVTLQENNGLAIVDLEDLSVTVLGLGFKDWSLYNIDANEDGAVSFGKYEGLYGLYQPDSIATYTWKDADFLVTANEGDAREYFFAVADEAECTAAGGQSFDADDGCLSYSDESSVADLTAAANSELASLQAAGNIDGLKVTSELGDADGNGEYEAAFTYGARSFTIWDQNGLVVFDSGDDFERITASVHGAMFNNDNDENASDSRSENKGPEPEAIAVGQVGDRTYAFIGLERMSGIMVYDVTNPYNAFFADYVINRDLTEGQTSNDVIGDLGPESITFVAAADSPTGNAMIVVGNEVSGTVTVWDVAAK